MRLYFRAFFRYIIYLTILIIYIIKKLKGAGGKIWKIVFLIVIWIPIWGLLCGGGGRMGGTDLLLTKKHRTPNGSIPTHW